MRAAYYEKNGPAREVLKLGEVETPRPGPGEVRIKLATSGVNPSDVKSREGRTRRIAFPRVIPHSDGAGVIDMVGDGVTASRVGERVWTWNAQWKRASGTCAEYVALPAAMAVRLPDHTSVEEGACLGIPAMTAHRCALGGGSVDGKTVLVTGGAGVVGHYAIQLAKWSGATVITTVSSVRKAEHARTAGADFVIDYKQQPVAERILELTANRGVDRIVEVELGGNLPVTARVLKSDGVVSAYASMGAREPVLPVYPLMARNTTIDMVLVYTMADEAKRRAIDDITAWLATGRGTFAIAARYPLECLAEAHDAVERGDKIGQVVIDIASD